MSRSEGKTIKVKPSLRMRMEIRTQRNLPLGTSLYPCVQGRGSGISPWRRSLFQSINFPCKNFKEIFSPLSVLNRRSFTGCNPSVYQKQEEEDCLERAGPAIQSPDAVCGHSLHGSEWVYLHTRQPPPPEINWLSKRSCYWIRAFGYIKARLWLPGLLQNVTFNFSSLIFIFNFF